MSNSIKRFWYIKKNCPHLTALLKSFINFMNNINKLHNSGFPWTETTLKSVKETNFAKKIKKVKKGNLKETGR